MNDSPWQGFWQILHDHEEDDIISYRNTTIAIRPSLGFVVFTRNHSMEIHALAKRQPPASWPSTDEESVAMLRAFRAYAGRCDWKKENSLEWTANESITMSSDPRLEGQMTKSVFQIEGDNSVRRTTSAKGEQLVQRLRRLSGPGTAPLAGAWETVDTNERWLYLVTAGHYGIMRIESTRPTVPSNANEFNDRELYALWQGFGANAGARLETKTTFDHWPMIAQVAGYEVRKHETFLIESVEKDSFVMSIPPNGKPGELWRRIERATVL